MKLRLSLAAAVDIRTANAWWRTNRPEAQALLHEELRRAFRILKAQPFTGVRLAGESSEAIRCIFLRGTRYQLYYSVSAEEIEVLRLWHASRRAKPKL